MINPLPRLPSENQQWCLISLIAMVYGEKITRSSVSNPCPVCHGSGCGQTSKKVLCFRVQEGSRAVATNTGAFIHDREGAEFTPYVRREAPLIAHIDRRSKVYSALLSELALEKKHGEELNGNKRRLSRDTIFRTGYKSVPNRMIGDSLASQLSKDFALNGVPGFWRKDGKWCFAMAGTSGYFIPLRDLQGRIQGLQIRTNFGLSKYLMWSSATHAGKSLPDGASSGTPHHFTGTPCETLIVTEGALKADVIAEALRRKNVADFTCGLVSVTTFENDFGAQLKSQIPFLKTVRLAFDADWQTNEKVQAQMMRFANSIKASRLKLEVVKWESEAKGYDDELLTCER